MERYDVTVAGWGGRSCPLSCRWLLLCSEEGGLDLPVCLQHAQGHRINLLKQSSRLNTDGISPFCHRVDSNQRLLVTAQ